MMLAWICPEQSIDIQQQQAASYLRKEFLITRAVHRVQLYCTALGVYIGYLNGKSLDNQALLPGFTDYRFRVQVQEFDVTDAVVIGQNVIGAVLGDGWYRGNLGIGNHRNTYGEKLQFACRMVVDYQDGTSQTIETDSSWRATQNGPLRQNDLKTGETYDARMEVDGWNTVGYDDSSWHPVKAGAYSGTPVPHEGEPILPYKHFKPTVLRTPNGETVLDFGQNMAGRVRFTVTGHEGHIVALTMGEVLDEQGNFTMKNLKAEGSSVISGEVGQMLTYTLKEGTQTYEPHFLISGFRYVKLGNWCEEVNVENFTAFAICSDCAEAGSFTCSNPQINQFVQNVQWSMRSNFVDIPTDCPTRERSGWTGDISVFAETASYLVNTERFLIKWLHDMMLAQRKDGSLPYIVPAGGKTERAYSCAGWSDAIANVAMTLYCFYGNMDILREVYPHVKRYVEFNRKRAKRRNPFYLLKFGKHRRYIIETGFHYGEWLEPGRKMYKDYIKALFVPDTEVTTAWFYHTVSQLVQMATLLGNEQDAKEYRALEAEILGAYRKEFLKDGSVHSKRHCRYVRPIAMGLATECETKEIAAMLNKKCIENNYKVGTGFLTTWLLLPTLTKYGYAETAYRMLENTEQPGWLFSVSKGATTTWENWFGLDENGVPVDSHNHYAPGAVTAWLFSVCAGISLNKPGFAEILIQPIPGGTLTWAKASYKSIQGEICSSWRIENHTFTLGITIPDGIPARIVLPNGETYNKVGGIHQFTCPMS